MAVALLGLVLLFVIELVLELVLELVDLLFPSVTGGLDKFLFNPLLPSALFNPDSSPVLLIFLPAVAILFSLTVPSTFSISSTPSTVCFLLFELVFSISSTTRSLFFSSTSLTC